MAVGEAESAREKGTCVVHAWGRGGQVGSRREALPSWVSKSQAPSLSEPEALRPRGCCQQPAPPAGGPCACGRRAASSTPILGLSPVLHTPPQHPLGAVQRDTRWTVGPASQGLSVGEERPTQEPKCKEQSELSVLVGQTAPPRFSPGAGAMVSEPGECWGGGCGYRQGLAGFPFGDSPMAG